MNIAYQLHSTQVYFVVTSNYLSFKVNKGFSRSRGSTNIIFTLH